MSEKKYMAEGLPFEDRCENAKKGLEFMWGTLVEIAEIDNAFMQKMKAEYAEPIGNSPRSVQAFLQSTLDETQELLSSSTEKLLSISWKGSISTLQPIWGEDAVEFALKAMRAEHQSSKN